MLSLLCFVFHDYALFSFLFLYLLIPYIYFDVGVTIHILLIIFFIDFAKVPLSLQINEKILKNCWQQVSYIVS